MKRLLSSMRNVLGGVCLLGLLFAYSTAEAQTVVARQDFDNPLNLISTIATPAFNSFSSSGDGFGVYQRGVSPTIPFDLLDDSAGSFPPDNLGIIKTGKTDAWFGIVDVENGDNPSGDFEAVWTFNIGGVSDLSVSIDMAAMGDFESSDVINFLYSIDGGPEQPLFSGVPDEGIDLTYTLESGTMVTLNDPYTMNGVILNNNLQTLTAPVTGSGSQLSIIFRGNQNAGGEAFTFDNILVESSDNGGGSCDQLFISEYIEGSGVNKCIEIYNPTALPVNLAAGGYFLEFYFNGNTSAGTLIALTGTVGPNDVYVVCDDGAASGFLAQADQLSTSSFFNGDDAVVLSLDGIPLDVIGQVGVDPGSQWGSGDASTQNNTIRRAFGVTAGDPDGSDPFDPSVEWEGFAQDDFSGLGAHNSTCGDQGGGDCAITDIVRSDVTACMDNGTPYIDDDFFLTNITVFFENAPAGGALQLIGDDGLLGSVPVDMLSGGSFMFKSIELPANGENLNVTAVFTDDAFCLLDLNLGPAPGFCSVVPACSYLFISEYVEGSSFNKCVEIYNPTSVAVDLDDFDIFLSFNGGTFENDIPLSGVIEPGDVFVLCNSSASSDFTSVADQLSGDVNFNGNDAVLLRDQFGVIDALGQLGNTSNYGQNVTLRRNYSVQAGDNNPFDAFSLAGWTSFPSNTFWGLGYHATDCQPALPLPWNPFNIGACQDGAVSENNGTWTLDSSCFNPEAGQDDLTFAFQQLCGDGEIIARVSSVDPFGRAGVMFREEMTPGSRYAWLNVPSNFWGNFSFRAFPNAAPVMQQFPNFGLRWLRLTRQGNYFRAYVSSNGVNWVLRGQALVPMQQCLFVGLALHSNVDGNPVSAVFNNVQINSGGLSAFEGPQTAVAPDAGNRQSGDELQVQPNPARHFLDVSTREWVEQTTIISIFDANGKRLFSDRFDRYGPTLRLDLDAMNLAPGMYFIHVVNGDRMMSERFIKQ